MIKILIFGENRNDGLALKELVLGICPNLEHGEVHVLTEPPTLQRGAQNVTVKRWAAKAAAATKAAKVRDQQVHCILVHCDADGSDEDGRFMRQRTEELRHAGLGDAHAIVPVDMIESWWLLHPEQTETVVKGWKGALSRTPGDVDRIVDAKSELRRRTRVMHPRRPYRESDSPDIARSIGEKYRSRKVRGTSASFERFVLVAEGCCKQPAIRRDTRR